MKLNQSGQKIPIQHYYQEQHNHCFGCGQHNSEGLQLKSYWDGKEAVASVDVEDKYNGIPNFVYGGLVASLIDCHAMATAAADFLEHNPDHGDMPRFVTGTLNVKYLKPTPLSDAPLKLRASVSERKGRKVTVIVELECEGQLTAEGSVIAFHIPETMQDKL